LNKSLHNFAVITLNNKQFIKDIINLAERNCLGKIKYELPLQDLRGNTSSAINAWECRLKYFSLVFLSKKIRRAKGVYDIEKLFIDTYLPPKFEQKVLTLMDKYGFEFFWYESILHLLLTGVWYLPKNASVIFINLESPRKISIPNKASLTLGVYSLTTREEIYYRWKEIGLLKKQMFSSLKERQKHRDLSGFIMKFKDREKFDNLFHTQNEKGREAFQKKIKRTEKSHNEFLSSYKKIPKDILLQILSLEDYSLSQIYIF
jgi:hypothetical protein